MEWVETTGRTVEEAKEAALDELGVDETDAEFEILEEAKMGLFGRVRSEARVRARVRPTTPRPKDDRRDRRRRKGPVRASGEGSGDGAAGLAEDSAGNGDGGGEEAPVVALGGSTAKREGRRHDAAAVNDRGERSVGVEMSAEERAEVARSFVSGVVERFGFNASVETAMDEGEDTLHIRVSGPDLGLLIGPRAATLAALQELTRTAVQRRSSTIGERIVVDVGGYWQRRREALERFARQVAEEVRTTGVRKALEPMSAADRKAVHDAVTEIDGVRTTSEGEDPRRRVIILPDDAA